MLRQAITLLFLLPLKVHQSQECPDSTHHVVGLSGEPLSLRPSNTEMDIQSVDWKMQLLSCPENYFIVRWKNGSNLKYEDFASKHFNRSLDFNVGNLSLLIKAAKPQDSGCYKLEMTKESGTILTVGFKVIVFDRVEQPLLEGQWKALGEGKCQVALSCLVSRDGNVSYTWYRGKELIPAMSNLTHVEVQIDVKDQHIYTCNVSNPASWASRTLSLAQGCLHVLPRPKFLPFLMIVLILLILFLVTLICFCVWRWKRKQSQTRPEAFLTIYEDVKNPQTRRNQKQKSPGDGITIYSMIQSSSPSQEVTNTLYALIKPSQKSGSKKKNHDPSFNCTIYEEVGKRQPRAHNPARLSRKELESFAFYS